MNEENRKELRKSVSGRYIRKNGRYEADHGWHRKWTYKIGWYATGEQIVLVAMTDGMTTKKMSKGVFSMWMEDNDMVFMTKDEMLAFLIFENGRW